MAYGPYARSKRARKRADVDARKVAAVNRRLNTIYELSKTVRDERHLNELLATIADDALRIETRKLIEPFLPFSLGRVELHETPAPFAAGGIVLATS